VRYGIEGCREGGQVRDTGFRVFVRNGIEGCREGS